MPARLPRTLELPTVRAQPAQWRWQPWRAPAAAPLPLPVTTRRGYARHPLAPKPVLDVKSIAKSPGLYEQNCIDRNYAGQARNPWRILELTQRRAHLQKTANERRIENNAVQKQIGELQRSARKSQQDAQDEATEDKARLEVLLKKAKAFKEDLAAVAEEEAAIEEEILDLALALPNLSSHHTPNGERHEVVEIVEPNAPELRYFSTIAERCLNRDSTSHVDISAELDLLDFAGAAKSSGWGWYYLKNEAALLEQALIQYSLSVLRKRGFTILAPPSIVYAHIAAACGFQPRDQHGEQQIYALQQAERDASKPPLCLAGTAEIPLAGMRAGHTFEEADLPLRTAAVSRCYRAEAGARGVDTKGLYRVHEFTKVEMFAWTVPPGGAGVGDEDGYFAASEAEGAGDAVFHEMVEIQKEILTALELTFRVLEMPAADLGGPAARKRDIEVLFPSRRRLLVGGASEGDGDGALTSNATHEDDGWGEVTSASACTDYQSRRLGARVRLRAAGGRLAWPHTHNATALAVPRVLAALLEAHWDPARRAVRLPPALRPWMGGAAEIRRG